MAFKLPDFLRSRKDISTGRLVDLMIDTLEGQFVHKDAHLARVNELLAASNENMERRRAAEKAAQDAELQVLRAVRFAHQNVALARAVDWVSRDEGSARDEYTLAQIKAFVAGFTGANDFLGGVPAIDHVEAFEAGQAAKRNHTALTSAAKSVGVDLA